MAGDLYGLIRLPRSRQMGLRRNRRDVLDKWFLLVFHGGLVGYLLLHNLAIPLVQNWGQGASPWRGLQYYFFSPGIAFGLVCGFWPL